MKKFYTIFLLFLLIFNIQEGNAQFTKLFDFEGTATGSYPYGSLFSDGTFMYGMTYGGGVNNIGTIFKIKPDGSDYEKLLDFAGETNGKFPLSSLISDGTYLYGLTQKGGSNDMGVVFKIKHDGSGYEKLLDFAGETNGSYPRGPLIADENYLYGMTQYGGTNDIGTIFKIKHDGSGYEKLLDFAGETNGKYPQSSLLSNGIFLYGMTQMGGTNDMGTIFKIMSDGTGFVKLLDFAGEINGSSPWRSLISDGTYLYGATAYGGTGDMGTIFKIKPDGTEFLKLLDFAGEINGSIPYSTLLLNGTFLYGSTYEGGTNNSGTIFKIKPDGSDYEKLFDFNSTTSGESPFGFLISDETFLYGMTETGGMFLKGVVFKYQYSNTTDIQTLSDNQKDLFYPNPFSFSTTLNTKDILNEATMIMYNQQGQVVKQLSNLSGQTITVYRDNLPNGLYYIHLREGNRIITTNKLIISY
ncbi:MAG: T9SS type A sorting domain-containing protein [Bacteroidales bacterium]|nr:T9SS type A sorting domain-containing protein [Bacteroidales bacterium]